ncbi:iron transporter [Actinomyces bouchesdurhonensis]|uniref:iron transporter n=1 Tax=Actinomyces bouchesdurhonensis TaxID=1852361 RepID=UPI0028E7F434|nr:iron transporter [Actinomyces bouchesdurhonensis]
MKRSLFRVGAALATLALAGTLAACSNNSSSSSSDTPAGPASASADPAAPAPGEDAGFEEQPLGDDVLVGPLKVGGVYFQPVDMEPEVGTPAAESSMHIEADVSAAADNKLGYGAGDFVPGLTVDYTIADKSGNVVQQGTLMPMNASDGPHYGLNLPKLDAGTYDVTFTIKPPSGWLLHTDKATGVEGRFWTEPLVAEFPDWQWDPAAVSW